MRKVLALSFVALLLVSSLPTVSACETEAARIANGQLPSPTGISPNKDDSIRETVRIAGIGQEVARGQLWMVLMGANMTEPVSYTHLTCRRRGECRSRWSPYH